MPSGRLTSSYEINVRSVRIAGIRRAKARVQSTTYRQPCGRNAAMCGPFSERRSADEVTSQP